MIKQFPFDEDGSLMHYPSDKYDYFNVITGQRFVRGKDYDIGLRYIYDYDTRQTRPNPDYKEWATEELQNQFKLGNIKWLQVAPIWKDNYVFDAEMTIKDFVRGRSAAGFFLYDEYNRSYYMYMSEFERVLFNATIRNSKVKGKWTFVKQGATHGLRLVEEL